MKSFSFFFFVVACFILNWLFPLTAAPTPSLPELLNVVASVRNWYSLGLNLGLGIFRLNQIERDYLADSNRRMVEMLTYWLRYAENPTWKDVSDALSEMGEHIAALEIGRKHSSSSSVAGMRLCLL